MWIVPLMLLLMQTHVIVDSKKHESPYSKDDCPKLKSNDRCSLNCHFLKSKAIKETRKIIKHCSSAKPISCDDVRSSKYRTIDGSCNNLKHPHWGMSNNCLRRLLPYDYSDGKSKPRISCNGGELPNARRISNVLHREFKATDTNFTLFFMTWGQAFSHDLSNNDIFRKEDGNFPISCCNPGPEISEKCISCEIPADDPFYRKYNKTCLNVVRTVPCPLCTSDERQHWNQNTGFHDLSIVYGQTKKDADSLRSKVDGQFIVQNYTDTGPLLPPINIEHLCVSPNVKTKCFRSGDKRTQQNLLLLTFQTLFMRHHNNVCLNLKKLNPHWKDETLYQEARRIVIAQVQYVTFGDYAEYILGPNIVKADRIEVLPGSQYTKYNPCTDASVLDEFTNSAQRYGHTLIPNEVLEIDPETEQEKIVPTKDIYFHPFGFYKGQFDAMAFGMSQKCHNEHDIHLSDAVRDFLYRNRTADEPTGKDLAAISILRGREHGIPGYVYYLKYCHCYTARSFKDLLKFIPCSTVILLQKVYKSIYDIDLYTGGLAEYNVEGGIIGPTFACIVRRQYVKTKFGDRFYFEHSNQAGSFTKDQLLAIKEFRLEKVICDNTKMERIQKYVFRLPSEENYIVDCDCIPQFNYSCFQNNQKIRKKQKKKLRKNDTKD